MADLVFRLRILYLISSQIKELTTGGGDTEPLSPHPLGPLPVQGEQNPQTQTIQLIIRMDVPSLYVAHTPSNDQKRRIIRPLTT